MSWQLKHHEGATQGVELPAQVQPRLDQSVSQESDSIGVALRHPPSFARPPRLQQTHAVMHSSVVSPTGASEDRPRDGASPALKRPETWGGTIEDELISLSLEQDPHSPCHSKRCAQKP